MGQSQSETAEFANAVREAARTIDAIVVDAFPIDGSAFIRVQLDAKEILDLLKAVKPRLLYLHEGSFDYDSEIEGIFEKLGIDGSGDFDVSPLSSLRTFRGYNGQHCQAYVAFPFDGILHISFEATEWYLAFEEAAEEVVDRLNDVLADNRGKANLQSALDVKHKARILADDPAFNFGRAGREKRTYLAENLFPECDGNEIYRIVDEATNIHWLQQQRQADQD